MSFEVEKELLWYQSRSQYDSALPIRSRLLLLLLSLPHLIRKAEDAPDI